MKATFLAVVLSLLAAHAPAQCAISWASFGPGPGVGGDVEASVAWDPDGNGPLPERLVVGGTFTSAGNVATYNIAMCDLATGTWSALGSGCDNTVRALAVLPNGELVAAGQFDTAGGTPVNRIARWDGLAWSPLGGGVLGYPTALVVAGNGDLIVGGVAQAGGVVVDGVARWDGTSWSALGGGLPNFTVAALLALPNGDLVASGGGQGFVSALMRWNGTTWSAFAGATGNLGLQALAAAANGDLYVAGFFTSIGGVPANNIARWNGTTWSALGSGTQVSVGAASIRALRVLPSGEVVVGGGFQSAGGTAASCIARWNGSTWSPLGLGLRASSYQWPSPWANQSAAVNTLATLANGTLVAAGSFEAAGTVGAHNVASWDGAQWSALSTGSGLDAVRDFVTLPGGDLVVVGGFAAAGPLAIHGVARWNGTAWSSLGSGGTNPGGVVQAAVRLPNGDLVIGGAFTSVGGVPATNIARWNGSQWSAMGALPGAVVHDLVVAQNGAVYAGGSFSSAAGVFVWNGSAWTAVAGVPGDVYALALLPDGRLVAGGFLGPANIAVWNGASWAQLGSGLLNYDAVRSLAVLPGGDLIAGTGYGSPGGGYAVRWNGSVWSPIGYFGRNVEALHVLPNGDLLAGGPFPGVVRWNGATWSAVGSLVFGQVAAMATSASGEVLVGGTFSAAGGVVSGGIARLATSCPAAAQSLGAGCAGGTVAASLPWTGSTWRVDASGLPNSALVFVVNGFAPASLPLSAVFATALPGCTLQVQPDYLGLTFANAGAASAQFTLPNTPSLAGTVFHHQMVPLALDSTLAVTATNALRLVVGSF
jgi:hypothetical protein